MSHIPYGEAVTDILNAVWPWFRGLFTGRKDQKQKDESLILELQQENESLRAELAGKAAFESRKNELEFRDGMYWEKDGSSSYCALCLDDRERFIHLAPQGPGYYYCRIHDHMVETREHRELIQNLPRIHSQRDGTLGYSFKLTDSK